MVGAEEVVKLVSKEERVDLVKTLVMEVPVLNVSLMNSAKPTIKISVITITAETEAEIALLFLNFGNVLWIEDFENYLKLCYNKCCSNHQNRPAMK